MTWRVYYGRSQLRIASEVSVLSVTCLHGLIGGIDDGFRSSHIRIAQAQVDHIIKGFCQDVRLTHGSRLVF